MGLRSCLFGSAIMLGVCAAVVIVTVILASSDSKDVEFSSLRASDDLRHIGLLFEDNPKSENTESSLKLAVMQALNDYLNQTDRPNTSYRLHLRSNSVLQQFIALYNDGIRTFIGLNDRNAKEILQQDNSDIQIISPSITNSRLTEDPRIWSMSINNDGIIKALISKMELSIETPILPVIKFHKSNTQFLKAFQNKNLMLQSPIVLLKPLIYKWDEKSGTSNVITGISKIIRRNTNAHILLLCDGELIKILEEISNNNLLLERLWYVPNAISYEHALKENAEALSVARKVGLYNAVYLGDNYERPFRTRIMTKLCKELKDRCSLYVPLAYDAFLLAHHILNKSNASSGEIYPKGVSGNLRFNEKHERIGGEFLRVYVNPFGPEQNKIQLFQDSIWQSDGKFIVSPQDNPKSEALISRRKEISFDTSLEYKAIDPPEITTEGPFHIISKTWVKKHWNIAEINNCSSRTMTLNGYDPLYLTPLKRTMIYEEIPDVIMVPRSQGFTLKLSCSHPQLGEVSVKLTCPQISKSCIYVSTNSYRPKRDTNQYYYHHADFNQFTNKEFTPKPKISHFELNSIQLPPKQHKHRRQYYKYRKRPKRPYLGSFNQLTESDEKSDRLFIDTVMKHNMGSVLSCFGANIGCGGCGIYFGLLDNTMPVQACAGPCYVGIGASCLGMFGNLYEHGYDQGRSVICTELYRQGLLDPLAYLHEANMGMVLMEKEPEVVVGYEVLASPVVWLMRRSQYVSRYISRIVTPFAEHVQYLQGFSSSDNNTGELLLKWLFPVCKIVGYSVTVFKSINTLINYVTLIFVLKHILSWWLIFYVPNRISR